MRKDERLGMLPDPFIFRNGERVKNAWIEFTDCYKIGYLKKIVGKFEFDIFNESTGNVLYEIRQGEFDVIYTYPDWKLFAIIYEPW